MDILISLCGHRVSASADQQYCQWQWRGERGKRCPGGAFAKGESDPNESIEASSGLQRKQARPAAPTEIAEQEFRQESRHLFSHAEQESKQHERTDPMCSVVATVDS